MVQSIGSPIAWNFGQEKPRTRAAKCRDYAERKRGRREAITNSEKLNPSKTQWYYVAIIQNNSLQAFSS